MALNCELVGIFMLSLLSKKFSSNNNGLYRDDRLSVFRNISGQHAEKHKKRFKKFSDKGSQMIIQWNLKRADYLAVTLNLTGGTYRLFHKTNEKTTYIHDHELSVLAMSHMHFRVNPHSIMA